MINNLLINEYIWLALFLFMYTVRSVSQNLFQFLLMLISYKLHIINYNVLNNLIRMLVSSYFRASYVAYTLITRIMQLCILQPFKLQLFFNSFWFV